MTIGLRRTDLAFIALLAWAGAAWAGPAPSSVADYNAAEVRLSNGVLVVPATVATYTAASTITIGSSFKVTLPSGITFGSVPALTSSGGSTFTLASGGLDAQTATFTVATSDLSVGQTISLASFTINGATALETVTPLASALPLTMQSIGNDASPVSFPAFASDLGAQAVFVGAIQFIDITRPSNATEFFAIPDTPTAVISAIAISTQLTDAATQSVPILGSNGLLYTLSPTDTATVTIPGNFGGIARVFMSMTPDCRTPAGDASINAGSVSIPNVVINREVFFCETGSGAGIQANPDGFPTVTVTPGTSTDFLSTTANVEFPGLICYSSDGNGCTAYALPAAAPTLSDLGMIALAGMILLFGVWKLRARLTT